MLFKLYLFYLPLLQVGDLGHLLLLGSVLLQLGRLVVQVHGPVGVPGRVLRALAQQVLTPVGVQVLARLLVHVLGTRRQTMKLRERHTMSEDHHN